MTQICSMYTDLPIASQMCAAVPCGLWADKGCICRKASIAKCWRCRHNNASDILDGFNKIISAPAKKEEKLRKTVLYLRFGLNQQSSSCDHCSQIISVASLLAERFSRKWSYIWLRSEYGILQPEYRSTAGVSLYGQRFSNSCLCSAISSISMCSNA